MLAWQNRPWHRQTGFLVRFGQFCFCSGSVLEDSPILSFIENSPSLLPSFLNSPLPSLLAMFSINPSPSAAAVATPPPNQSTSSPPSVRACGSGGACTASQVAQHSIRSDCWVYLSVLNKVYNITEYVSNPDLHPGSDVIAPFCGQDVYAVFKTNAGGHNHSGSARADLDTYYIGPFQP